MGLVSKMMGGVGILCIMRFMSAFFQKLGKNGGSKRAVAYGAEYRGDSERYQLQHSLRYRIITHKCAKILYCCLDFLCRGGRKIKKEG